MTEKQSVVKWLILQAEKNKSLESSGFKKKNKVVVAQNPYR